MDWIFKFLLEGLVQSKMTLVWSTLKSSIVLLIIVFFLSKMTKNKKQKCLRQYNSHSSLNSSLKTKKKRNYSTIWTALIILFTFFTDQIILSTYFSGGLCGHVHFITFIASYPKPQFFDCITNCKITASPLINKKFCKYTGLIRKCRQIIMICVAEHIKHNKKQTLNYHIFCDLW